MRPRGQTERPWRLFSSAIQADARRVSRIRWGIFHSASAMRAASAIKADRFAGNRLGPARDASDASEE